ncbi:hypothetical protein [Verrucomicrobium sp. GAS474]|uniref:hypothetical protein n=1 Tax=Verrucomicrobium sp. GAS474 TaxID=1882831 RepID=UPI000B8409CD|nr:hypothetical protein [Verrucomicrobium sp. GAS474]
MKAEEFDCLVGDLARQPVPPLDPRFNDAVWRAIRQRKAEAPSSVWSLWDGWIAALLRPQPILASFALAVAFGLFSGVLLKESRSAPTTELSVFSAHAPGMLATLMEH